MKTIIYKEDWEKLEKGVEQELKSALMTIELHKAALRKVRIKAKKACPKPNSIVR